jgi:lipid-binding SYLF domain-containing protein
MSDRKRNHIPADRSRVNIYEQYELEYWTKKWNCTAAELRAAVAATDSIMAATVETYLKTKGTAAGSTLQGWQSQMSNSHRRGDL